MKDKISISINLEHVEEIARALCHASSEGAPEFLRTYGNEMRAALKASREADGVTITIDALGLWSENGVRYVVIEGHDAREREDRHAVAIPADDYPHSITKAAFIRRIGEKLSIDWSRDGKAAARAAKFLDGRGGESDWGIGEGWAKG